jgi:hypothetical protein
MAESPEVPKCTHQGYMVPLVSEMVDVEDKKAILTNAQLPVRTLMMTRTVLCIRCGQALDIHPGAIPR